MGDIYNSKLARFLGRFSKDADFAITTSKTCCRYSCPEREVSIYWRKHEECHKRQFVEMGWLNFVAQYLLESIRHGYWNNKFEVEARKASEEG